MVSRLALLFSLTWVMGLTADLFSVVRQGISGRDLVLLFGGLFLLYKASHEIFIAVEARRRPTSGPACRRRGAGAALLGHDRADRASSTSCSRSTR